VRRRGGDRRRQEHRARVHARERRVAGETGRIVCTENGAYRINCYFSQDFCGAVRYLLPGAVATEKRRKEGKEKEENDGEPRGTGSRERARMRARGFRPRRAHARRRELSTILMRLRRCVRYRDTRNAIIMQRLVRSIYRAWRARTAARGNNGAK